MNVSPTAEVLLERIRSRTGSFVPEVAFILGSGLGSVVEQVQDAVSIPYAEVSLFPQTSVAGHRGELVAGRLFGRNSLLFCGRFHVYQGLSAFETTAPVRLAAAMGCKNLLLSCAVGGIAEGLAAGDFLLIRDHLNFSGLNPLQGVSPPRFVDLHDCYRHDFEAVLQQEAACLERGLLTGVLAYMPGPSYETPAEIAALRLLGADAVSMSTVPEAIMARALGLQVAALALVTNMAGGSAEQKLSHQEVLECAVNAKAPFTRLLEILCQNLYSR